MDGCWISEGCTDVEDGGLILGIDGGRSSDVSDCRSSWSLPCIELVFAFPMNI